MHTILLPFTHSLPVSQTLKVAVTLGAPYQSYIEGAYVRQALPIIAGEGITLPGDYLAQFEQESRQLCQEAKQAFEDLAAEMNLPMGVIDQRGQGARCGWVELSGGEGESVGEHARLFEVTILTRQVDSDGPDWRTTCEAVLFESGRPVLILGDDVPEVIGKHIVIAWNGSMETARTITAGRSLLERAEQITVLTIEGGAVPGPDTESVAKHLRAAGYPAEAVIIDKGALTIGQAIVSECERRGGDLLFKGAYTHSRLRQMIFGGATQEIIQGCRLPVFLSH